MKPPPEQFRLTLEMNVRMRLPSHLESDASYGMNGMFIIPLRMEILRVVVSDQAGWEHVSVSLKHRTPTWDEMCYIKDLFWEDEVAVVQFHPKKSDYVNYHPHCLHPWKQTGADWDTPPKIFVGPSK